MKRAGILAIGCALAMSTGAFAQSGAPGQPSTPGTSGTPGTTGPDRTGTQGPIGAGTDRTMPNDQQNDQQRRANDTQEFIKKAAIANMAEIQLGQLAGTKAESPEVKQFAQKMVDEHTKALDELKQAASASGATLPTELDKKHQKLHDKLSKLSGAEFDREYMDAMVDAHKDAAKLLEKRSKDTERQSASTATSSTGSNAPTTTGTSGTTATAAAGAGSGVTEWASKTLPDVQSHLQEAQQIDRSLESAKKNNSGNTGSTGATGTTGTSGASGTSSPNGGSSGSGSNTPPE
jgi:putative membrane protein